MPEFIRLIPPPEALTQLINQLEPIRRSEVLPTQESLGRVTAVAVEAPQPLPTFRRSTVDGYALRAADSFGASESLPMYLDMRGEVRMGALPVFPLEPGECALIHTGGMLPENADAVVMIEHTQVSKEDEIEVLRSVALGENVIKIGEDVKRGETVIPAGRRLRPAEIGGLMALGQTTITVAGQTKVGILSTGDEVRPPESDIGPGQVRDINTYSLAALVVESGGEPRPYGIIPDRAQALFSAASEALAECDMVVITAGSSASVRDLTAQVIDDLGEPGVLVHGVNVRPGKPTILGCCDGKPVIGLPGNPVSALVIAGLFVKPVIELLLGLENKHFEATQTAELAVNLASTAGREDWIPVRLQRTGAGYRADPVFGKSNLIFTLVSADGLVRIQPDATGLAAGENVEVQLL